MKKNKKILVVLALLVLLTGCTREMKSADGKPVTAKETKQVLVENVLCKPDKLMNEYKESFKLKKSDLKKMYTDGDLSKKEYNKKLDSIPNLDKLPACTKMSAFEGGYETLWTSVFVKPLAWLIIQIGLIFKNYGVAIIIATILIRMVLYPLSRKMLKQSEYMKKAQPKLAKIEKKYADKNDQQSMMLKSNEMMQVYKEYKINPVSGCLLSFIQIPLFFAFYESLNRLPILFEDKFLGFNMGMTPWAGAELGHWYYLVLPVIVGLVTYFSFKINNISSQTAVAGQEKQMKMMFNIMVIMIFVTSFKMSTAIILYWIISSLFTIIQNLLVKRSK